MSPQAQPGEDAFIAAVALAAMDAGTVDAPWSTLYHETPPDQVARLALGRAIADALKAASNQSAAFAADKLAAIRQRVVRGMMRQRAYAVLRAEQLVAFNGDLIALQATGTTDCGPGPDPNSGTWPYPNEPIPPSSGLCAFIRQGVRPMAHPDAVVSVAGAFGLGCDETFDATISFDANDRVSKVTVGSPNDSCV